MRRLALLFVLAIGALSALPHAASAQSGSERITTMTSPSRSSPTARSSVRETIVYDFGSNARHGIQRDLVRSERYDDDNDRRYDIDVLSVSASEGTPDDVQLSDEGPFRRIRIGDPDRTITGQHTYTIDYTVGGAMLPFTDHDELYWDVIGHEWGVPIERASVQVQAPADITEVACFVGPDRSSLPCSEATASGRDRDVRRE